MPVQNFAFTGAAGHELAGRIGMPAGTPRAYALFAHCFTCTKESIAAVRVARALAADGIAVLRFDFTGLGDSGGDFADASFSGDVADLVAAAKAMAAAGFGPALMIGHSLGGAAVLAAALELPGVKAVATINAPFDVDHVKGQFGDALKTIVEQGEAEVDLGGRPFTVRRGFIDDLARHDQAPRIAALDRPLLILHAPTDDVVGIDNASQIFVAAKHPKSFVALDGADHLLTRAEDAQFAAALIAAWATRYIPAVEAKEEAPSGVIAALTGAGKFQTRIAARGGAIIADEPIEAGGLASGPTPYELLGAGLAACTVMTLNLYGARKGWDMAGIAVEVAHSNEAGLDRFTRQIGFAPGTDADQRARLLEIADRCPVHRTLERASQVVTVATPEMDPALGAEPAAQHVADMEAACEGDER